MAFIPETWLRRGRQSWPPLALVFCSGLVIALVLLGAPPAIRAVPVLTYIAIVPGLACVRLMRLPNRLTEFLLGVGLSFALGIIVAMAMLYAQQWSPTMGIVTLASIASIAAAVELLHHRPGLRVNPSIDRRSS